MSKRSICILNFLSVLLISINCFSQDKIRDSLKLLASKNSNDTSVIDAAKQLSFLLQEDAPDESIRYGLIALQKSKAIKDSFRTAQSGKSIGIAYDIKGNLDSCLFYLNTALSLFGLINRTNYQSHTLTDKAMAYYYRGNYELALRNHLAALELRKKLGNEKFIAQSYLNIGLVYRSRKDYANAVKFYHQSFEIKNNIGDSAGMLNSLINLGAAYQSNAQFDSAYHYGLKGLELATRLASDEDIIACKENIAASLVNLSRPDEALHYLQEADKERKEENKKAVITNAETYGDLFLQKGNLPLAIQYFEKGLTLAKSNSRMEAAEVFARKLSSCYYKQGDYKKAYNYITESKIIGDTLLNAENSRQINEMNAVYETAEKEHHIETLNIQNTISSAEATQRKRERNYFIIASVLFLALAFVAYKAFINNKKKKEQLNTQNHIIEKSLAEKEILLREIHHRVKNNLQIVSSLLSLQSNYIKDELALDAVKESRNRVQSMSLIHQNLYGENNLTTINVQEYIEQLTDNLFRSYNIHPDKIKLEKKIAPMNLDVDTIIPIGLILNELITNCLKYAFTDVKEGLITVGLKENNNKLLLSVYDNGTGLQEGFKAGEKKSFGHKMITAFLKKLKGNMKMYNQGGTRVDIEIENFKSA